MTLSEGVNTHVSRSGNSRCSSPLTCSVVVSVCVSTLCTVCVHGDEDSVAHWCVFNSLGKTMALSPSILLKGLLNCPPAALNTTCFAFTLHIITYMYRTHRETHKHTSSSQLILLIRLLPFFFATSRISCFLLVAPNRTGSHICKSSRSNTISYNHTHTHTDTHRHTQATYTKHM